MVDYAAFKLVGKSMEPILTIGDVILVKKVTPHDLTVADMIVFEHNNQVIVHRFVGTDDKGGLLTKPEVTIVQTDPYPITHDRLIGKVIAAYRGTKEISIGRSSIMARLYYRSLLALNRSPVYLKMKSAGYFRLPYLLITRLRRLFKNK